jgi:NADH:ubiquinone oxidoreductase subunit F (NADH-binding)/ferredoxin
VTAVPQVLRIGQARLTAGLDRLQRIDLAAHNAIFGTMPAMTANELIMLAEQVDLRGRGGAAFPVAAKLQAVATSARARKCRTMIVINAAEGEPGSAKDKMLLLRSPYLVLAGARLAAKALRARQIVVAVAGDGPHVRSVTEAVNADPDCRRAVIVVSVPDRFVSGEGGALVNAMNGKAALPPGRKRRASDSGPAGLPTLLSNAETFAQLAVLALSGPAGYASAGSAAEPGTVLLTVSGSVARPAVVEVPTGIPLGEVLDLCAAQAAEGVLVGGYHGMWLGTQAAYDIPVSRAGLIAAGGTLGAGVVLPLGERTCPLGEVARVAGYLAKESSGQCGPCMLGLPAIARALAALANGSGGVEALDAARRAAAAVRGRGACSHPDGVFRFVVSALDVFTGDIAAHLFRGTCGRPVRRILPLTEADSDARLEVDWTRCQGHGLCAHLVPELIQLDRSGYPEFLEMPVPFWLAGAAEQAVAMCPALALRLTQPPPAETAASPAALGSRNGRTIGKRGRDLEDLIVTESWIAEISGSREFSGETS